MGIRIVIASTLVTRDRFIEALEEGFKNSSAGTYALYDIELFKQYLNDPFNKGDEILLTYHPGDAVYLYKNGIERGSFPRFSLQAGLICHMAWGQAGPGKPQRGNAGAIAESNL